MTPYKDLNNNSGVRAYNIGQSHIDIEFKDGTIFRYTSITVGQVNLEKMAHLAREGVGLNTFVNRVVRDKYAAKLQ